MYLDYYDYIALIIFLIFAAFVPVSFIVASKMLRPKRPDNPVKGTPYESAEQPIGTHMDVINEYMGFFALFLPFEIIGILLVLWAPAARSLDIVTNIFVLGLAVVSMVLALAGYRLIGARNAGRRNDRR